jgi:hypothetical protein
MAIPKKIIVSDILSKVESRNAPFLDDFLVILATLPSITSKNPEINNIILPIIEEFKSTSICKELSPKKIEAIIAIIKPIRVKALGENPIDENKIPIFSKIGCKFSLNLFSNNSLNEVYH